MPEMYPLLKSTLKVLKSYASVCFILVWVVTELISQHIIIKCQYINSGLVRQARNSKKRSTRESRMLTVNAWCKSRSHRLGSPVSRPV
jgi:hypothetical protein